MVLVVSLAGLVAVLALGLVLVVRGRRSAADRSEPESSPMMRLEPGELAALDVTSIDLETVLGQADVTMYIPVDGRRTFLAVSGPGAAVEGRSSAVPSQLAAAAVAGQSGIEAMVRAGQLTGKLVLVDDKTAAAIKAGKLVEDQFGNLLGIIRERGKFAGVTRIKPLSGSLVKSAAAGPAMLSAIAMQAQLAEVEKAISEVRDSVNAVRGYLEAAERASVEGRRQTISTVYRTASEAGEMTQSLWDQINGLESDLRRDVRLADENLAVQVTKLQDGASGLVGPRLRWLQDASGPIAGAVAGVADARRALVQFSMLRLWWLAVTGDPTLTSRQNQLRELLAELPAHDDERERVAAALMSAGRINLGHRVLAPRKHKTVGSEVESALDELVHLPWAVVDVQRTAELEND
ncbi:MAG: hypothetical protein NTV23_05485 [Propionibacteriales bacterium]|nr:hypothetical protein [Propionibacteriales bacterium]